jgi:high mobility group protein B2
MTSLVHSKNITTFISTFLEEHGSEDMLEKWNDPSNMQAFNQLMLDAADAVKRNKIKDPKKPKRGKSAYICFCTKNREAAKKALGDGAKATEVTSHLGEMWRALKESKKASDKKALAALELEAAEDKARYNEEIKDYIAPSDDELLAAKKGSKKKSDKDPNAPKRNKTAYIYFCSDKRAEAKSELGDDAKATEVTALLGKMWKELKEDDDRSDELEKYNKLAADDKLRYNEEVENYSANDEQAPTKKGSKKKSDKDPNAPKRNKTAYIYFCSDKRAEAKSELGDDAKATEVTALLGKMWKDLKEDEDRSDELEKYTKMASDDKSRYENETKKVGDSTDDEDKPVKQVKPVGKKVVDDTKPAKSKTGYTYFCQSNRESVKDDNPEMKATEVTKELARLWKELSDEDKQEWSDSAKQI